MTPLALAAVIATMTSARPPSEELTLTALHPEELHPGKVSRRLAARGEVQGAQVAPGGEVVALVSAGGRLQLVRWSAAGAEKQRRDLEAPGPAAAWRLFEDGSLTVLTPAALLRVDAAGKVARRPISLPVKEAERAAVGPGGAWLAFRDRLVHVGMEGEPLSRPAPISAPGPEFLPQALLVTGDGGCLLAEELRQDFEVSGTAHRDLAVQTVLSLLDARGQVKATRTLGEVTSWKEWFWKEKLPGNASPVPSSFGLVRTRHGGQAKVGLLAQEANGDFLVAGDGLYRLDGALQARWQEGTRVDASVVSPAWMPGLVLSGGGGAAFRYDEKAGAPYRAPLREVFTGRLDLTRAALGKDPAGAWFLVTW
ncbi:MAG: hypothetical protein HZB56_16685 [Deltaproteobacteria bacterium]|nr:hypothetical protein [Deltaproteobacteria bacterium]